MVIPALLAKPAVGTALALLKRFWYVLPLLGLIIALWATRGTLSDVKKDLAWERSDKARIVADVEAKTASAKLADMQNVARVSGEQAEITKEVQESYAQRIDAIRADFARRVRDATAKAGGGGGVPVVPGASEGATRTVEAPRSDGLPPKLALIASEQAIQLDELINWVLKQQAVDTTGNVRGSGESPSPAQPAS